MPSSAFKVVHKNLTLHENLTLTIEESAAYFPLYILTFNLAFAYGI